MAVPSAGWPNNLGGGRNHCYLHAFCLHIGATNRATFCEGTEMNSIIYLVGLVVVVLAILSFVGMR